MNTVTLKADGRIAVKQEIVQSDPLMYLSCKTELDDAYSLRGCFRMFEAYPALLKLNAFSGGYMEQYQKSPASGCAYDGFDFLEFSKTVEMVGFPGKPRLEIYTSLNGVCGKERTNLRAVQLEDILDMPLRLGGLRHIVFGDKVDVFDFETVFNLFEFIDGVLWDLSFHGTLMACELRR